MYSVERRYIRGDLIEAFKIVNGLEGLDKDKYFKFEVSHRTRGHNRKIYKERVETEIRRKFFSNRIVDRWNELPQEVINSKTVDTFKNRLDKYMDEVLSGDRETIFHHL